MQKIKSFILWLFTPVQYVFQKLGNQEAKIRKIDVDAILILAQPGDILLSYESGRPTSIAIPGMYKHATIVSDRLTVIEAVGDKWVRDRVTNAKINDGGVRETDLVKWLYQVDKVALIRPKFNRDVRFKAGANARAYIGTSYDYQFEYGSEKIYCSELPYLCYKTETKEFMKNEPEHDEILPQRYRDLCDQISFELIYEYIAQ